MQRIFAKKFMVWIMSMSVLGTPLPSISNARLIGTQALIEKQQTDAPRARVEEFVARENVREQIIALGADPAEVQERLAALTADELRLIEQNIDNMPAGGILVIIGIVFVVLIILDLTGVVDIFK